MALQSKTLRKSDTGSAGGATNLPDSKDGSAPKGIVDDDMSKYGAVAPQKVPKVVDTQYQRVAGGGRPGSFQNKKKTGTGGNRPAQPSGRN